MKRFIILFLGIILFGIVGPAAFGDAEGEKRAIASAEAWLQLVDHEHYAESWEEAAAYFKAAISKDTWQDSLRAVRKPLGKTIIRTLSARRYETTLPGAPDGEYVVIQYKTSFQNKKSAVETITPMLDKNGTWRVSGYFIK
jgi:hypothetical protein